MHIIEHLIGTKHIFLSGKNTLSHIFIEPSSRLMFYEITVYKNHY